LFDGIRPEIVRAEDLYRKPGQPAATTTVTSTTTTSATATGGSVDAYEICCPYCPDIHFDSFEDVQVLLLKHI